MDCSPAPAPREDSDGSDEEPGETAVAEKADAVRQLKLGDYQAFFRSVVDAKLNDDVIRVAFQEFEQLTRPSAFDSAYLSTLIAGTKAPDFALAKLAASPGSDFLIQNAKMALRQRVLDDRACKHIAGVRASIDHQKASLRDTKVKIATTELTPIRWREIVRPLRDIVLQSRTAVALVGPRSSIKDSDDYCYVARELQELSKDVSMKLTFRFRARFRESLEPFAQAPSVEKTNDLRMFRTAGEVAA